MGRRTSRYKGRGWHGESHRHYLASKGIKTKRNRKYYAYDPTYVSGDLPLIFGDALGTAGASVASWAWLAGPLAAGAVGVKVGKEVKEIGDEDKMFSASKRSELADQIAKAPEFEVSGVSPTKENVNKIAKKLRKLEEETGLTAKEVGREFVENQGSFEFKPEVKRFDGEPFVRVGGAGTKEIAESLADDLDGKVVKGDVGWDIFRKISEERAEEIESIVDPDVKETINDLNIDFTEAVETRKTLKRQATKDVETVDSVVVEVDEFDESDSQAARELGFDAKPGKRAMSATAITDFGRVDKGFTNKLPTEDFDDLKRELERRGFEMKE